MELTLVDTSAWIEWLRATGSAGDQAVQRLREEPQRVAVTQPVRLEVLAGLPERKVPIVDGVLGSAVPLDVEPGLDFDAAAELFRSARSSGRTVRALFDCLIAAVAIRTGAVLLHRDRDFDVLADIAADLRSESTLD